jgi:hypothetical protein
MNSWNVSQNVSQPGHWHTPWTYRGCWQPITQMNQNGLKSWINQDPNKLEVQRTSGDKTHFVFVECGSGLTAPATPRWQEILNKISCYKSSYILECHIIYLLFRNPFCTLCHTIYVRYLKSTQFVFFVKNFSIVIVRLKKISLGWAILNSLSLSQTIMLSFSL